MRSSPSREETPKGSEAVVGKLRQLFDELLRHDGYGRIEIDMKILRRGQKEVVLRCGKEYRYIVDFPAPAAKGDGAG